MIKNIFSLKYFIMGLILTQKINVGLFDIYMSEIFSFIYVIINFKTLKKNLNINEISFIKYGIFWAILQLMSDLINGTDYIDALKGIFAPIFFIVVSISLISIFKSKFLKLPSFLLGNILGTILLINLSGDIFFEDNPWKWGYGNFFINLFLIYSGFFLKKNKITLIIECIIVVLFLAISLYFNSRSGGIIPLISLFIYLLVNFKKGLINKIKNSYTFSRALLLLLVVALPLNLLISETTLLIANVSESFSTDASEKGKLQSNNDYGALLSGRPEILINLIRISEKPLLGYGSWAKDNGASQSELIGLLFEGGYGERIENGAFDSNLIPVHSMLFGSMVWGGILTCLFWINLLRIMTNLLIQNLDKFPLFLHFLYINLVWSVFFSPFGAANRWQTSITVMTIFVYSYSINKYKKN